MTTEDELDALVVGAGFAGLYTLHLLREQGLRVRAYDAAGDVGGTWWWHYYPGARLDTEGYTYQYLALPALYEEWGWSERFPAGYEVQRWLRVVAERLDLRRDVRLATTVVGARFDGTRWWVSTDDGETVTTRHLVSCAGLLPVERHPDGVDDFAGLVLRTAHWPERYPDLAGRRVGVVGTGAVGVQLVPAIAGVAGHLTVFASDPPDLLPMTNTHYGWQERDAYRARRAELRDTVVRTASGAEHEPHHVWADTAEREKILDEAYRDGSRRLWLGTFDDVAGASELVRARMRARLDDDRHRRLLVPTGQPFGRRRVALEQGYLEVFGRDDVDLVDGATIARVRPEGVELADGTLHRLDVLALTDEVDAGPPALTRVDLRGPDGEPITGDAPNLLTTTATSPTPSTDLQLQAERIAAYLRPAGPTSG